MTAEQQPEEEQEHSDAGPDAKKGDEHRGWAVVGLLVKPLQEAIEHQVGSIRVRVQSQTGKPFIDLLSLKCPDDTDAGLARSATSAHSLVGGIMARKRRGNGRGTLIQRTPGGIWKAIFTDHAGKRRERSTGTTDKRAAERVLAKLLADEALRAHGVVTSTDDEIAHHARRPLADHLNDYIGWCENAGHATKAVQTKRMHIERFAADARASRLCDLVPDRVEGHLETLTGKGRSARLRNAVRQNLVAFESWCFKRGRLRHRQLPQVPRADENADRRRIRRALTDDEVKRLITVARAHGREAWYLAALHAGLRRGDLVKLEWRDIDLSAGILTIREGKAKRVDTLPMHEELRGAFATMREGSLCHPRARVWPVPVTDKVRAADFAAAGIPDEDDEGRVADLHSLRTTLGTRLARAGVIPQVAQRIMRHANYATTMKHYLVLGLTDSSDAIDRLPPVGHEPMRATGTTGKLQQQHQQFCEGAGGETGGVKAGDRTRTDNIQLGRLTLYH